jgi:capsular exopolysaccharide synthesis family protein
MTASGMPDLFPVLRRRWQCVIGPAVVAMGVALLATLPAPDFLLTLGIGLALGFGWVLVAEYRDDAIRADREPVRRLGIPILGTVVRDPSLPGFVAHERPGSPAGRCYRSLGTSLLMRAPGERTILITSASPSEGKTTTAINLAITLARSGSRTLLVSTDFRQPRLDEAFFARARGGLSGIVEGRVTRSQTIVDTEVPNLRLLPCGRMPRRPEELLASEAFRSLVRDLRAEYEYVVFDSPPAGKVPEARVMAGAMDCTVFVVRANRTSARHARGVLKDLAAAPGARIAGAVLNDVATA